MQPLLQRGGQKQAMPCARRRWSPLLLAAGLAATALPASPQAPDCEAAACPPVQLRLDEGFEVSRRRLAEAPVAAVRERGTAAPSRVTPQAPAPAQAQAPAASPSPWLVGSLALVAGMLLQLLLQTLGTRLRARARPVAGAVRVVLPTPLQPPAAVCLDELPAEPAGPVVEFVDEASAAPRAAVDEPQAADAAVEILPAPEVFAVPVEEPPCIPDEAPRPEEETPAPAMLLEESPLAQLLTEVTGETAPEAPPTEAIAEASALDAASELDTVALLRRLSAQRARGVHPEGRLAAVFRLVATGQADSAARILGELEAQGGDDVYPTELITTNQYIARRRERELRERIEGLRAGAHGEAAGRRLAVAGAFLKRGRLKAVAEVLDELESDLREAGATP